MSTSSESHPSESPPDRPADLPSSSDSPSSEAVEAQQPGAERQSAGGTFSLRRVLLTVLVVVIVGGAGTAGWWYFVNRTPPLYRVHGVVYLDGKPMTEGYVTTYYVDRPNLLGGLSPLDENGQFELATNGQPGVYAGEHKIMVVLTSGGFPPVSLIPEKYSNKHDTPFRIVVGAQTANSPVKLELFGRKKAPRAPAGGFSRPLPPGAPRPSDANRQSPLRSERRGPQEDS